MKPARASALLLALLAACAPDDDPLRALPDAGADTGPLDAEVDGPALDAAPDAAPDASPDAGPPACAPLDAAEALSPPALAERAGCAEGDALRISVPAGSAVVAWVRALDGAVDAALWWPAAEGGLRVDAVALAAGEEAVFAFWSPAEGAVVEARGGPWRLAVTAGPPAPAVAVDGVIAGWRRPVTDAGLMPAEPFSTAGARVDLVDADGRLLGAGRVGADGAFALAGHGPADAAALLRLVADARGAGVPVRVGPDGELPWAEAVAEVQGSATVDAALDPEGAAAGAWFVARTTAEGLDRLAARVALPAVVDPPPVRVRWRPGFSDACGSCFRPGARPLIDLGGRVGDPDEWDAAVILHELGHYVAAVFSRDDSGGGPHDGSPIAPAVAWSEGLATFHAGWQQGDAVQLDYKITGVARLDLEVMDDPRAFGTADGSATGDLSERLVAAVLWDLHDAPPEDDDPAGLSDGRLFAPLFEVLAGAWVDRGAPGVDLLDYLDALWCAGPEPAGAAAVLAERAVPHTPSCRRKSAGPLAVERLPDGRLRVRSARAGRLVLFDGARQAVEVRAGQAVDWRPAKDAPLWGVELHHPGGRAVVPLRWPEAAPAPMRRRAGAWEVSGPSRSP